MSVSKLTKAAFIVLIVCLSAAFASGFTGRRLAMAAFAAPSAASIGLLVFLVFRRVLHPLLLLTAAMKAAGLDGAAPQGPGLPVEVPDDEFGQLAAHCNRLYAALCETAAGRKQMISFFPGPVISLDRDAKVAEMNRAALDSGMPGTAVGRPFTSVIPSGRAAAFETAFRDASGKERPETIELPVKLDNGGVSIFSFSLIPMKNDGRFAGALLAGRDMDECARLSRELEAVRSEAKVTEEKLNSTIKDLEEFALMAVRREIKMKQIREKLTELREARDAKG